MKCVILTIAYNAEKTVSRTIESVLAQTGADWTYYILDHGSTDTTYEVCSRYAQKDDRIVLWREKENNPQRLPEYYERLLSERKDAVGFCTVDADDVLTPDFLCTAVPLMEKHEADLVILGTELLDAVTGNVLVSHVVPYEIVISRKNISDMFPEIHWFLRQLWCKLYRVSVMRSYKISIHRKIYYGGDTELILQFLSHADKFVLAPVCGYRYNVSPQSSSYQFMSGRYKENQILHQYTMDFLEKKAGYISERNREFLLAVYANSLKDTLRVVVRTDAPLSKKLVEIYGIYCNPITEELFRRGSAFMGQKDWLERMNAPVAACMLVGAEQCASEDIKLAASVFEQMNEQFIRMIAKEHLQWMMVNAPRVVEEVALCHYEKAYSLLWNQLDKGELPCCECTLLLGQFLSGVLSLEKEYVMFSRLLIEWYIENGQKERACKELSDWLLMLPDDAELIRLKERAMEMSGNG